MPSLRRVALWWLVPLVGVTAGAVLIRPRGVSRSAVQSDACLGKGVGRAGHQEDSKPSKVDLANAEGCRGAWQPAYF